jgi:hypothetical protein
MTGATITRFCNVVRWGRNLIALCAVVCITSAALVSVAAASESGRPDVQRLIDRQLRITPGGQQIAPNRIAWKQHGVEMTFGAQPLGASSCAYYHFCLYGDSNYNDGPDVTPWMLSFYYCNLRHLKDWGVQDQASSAVNNQTPGTWASLHTYRANGAPGWIQIWAAGAYYADPQIPNDIADVVDPC